MNYKMNPTKQDKPHKKEEEPLPLPSDEDRPLPAPIREPEEEPPMGDPKPKEPPRLV